MFKIVLIAIFFCANLKPVGSLGTEEKQYTGLVVRVGSMDGSFKREMIVPPNEEGKYYIRIHDIGLNKNDMIVINDIAYPHDFREPVQLCPQGAFIDILLVNCSHNIRSCNFEVPREYLSDWSKKDLEILAKFIMEAKEGGAQIKTTGSNDWEKEKGFKELYKLKFGEDSKDWYFLRLDDGTFCPIKYEPKIVCMKVPIYGEDVNGYPFHNFRSVQILRGQIQLLVTRS